MAAGPSAAVGLLDAMEAIVAPSPPPRGGYPGATITARRRRLPRRLPRGGRSRAPVRHSR